MRSNMLKWNSPMDVVHINVLCNINSIRWHIAYYVEMKTAVENGFKIPIVHYT